MDVFILGFKRRRDKEEPQDQQQHVQLVETRHGHQHGDQEGMHP